MDKLKILQIFLNLSLGLVFTSFVSAQSRAGTEQIVSNGETTMKVQHYNDVVDNYLRYLNEKDLEGILSLYADSATVEDPVGSETLTGKMTLRKFYTGAVNIDLTVTRTGPVRIAGVEAAFPFQLLMNMDGTPMITDIIDVFCFDEAGKIVSMRAFWGPTNRKPATK